MPVETLVVNVGPAGAKTYTFTKQPQDKLRYTFDYTEWLSDAEGVSISTHTITINPSDVALSPPTSSGGTIVGGTKVTVMLDAGGKGYAGKVTCKATMTDGRIKEAEFTLYIQEF